MVDSRLLDQLIEREKEINTNLRSNTRKHQYRNLRSSTTTTTILRLTIKIWEYLSCKHWKNFMSNQFKFRINQSVFTNTESCDIHMSSSLLLLFTKIGSLIHQHHIYHTIMSLNNGHWTIFIQRMKTLKPKKKNNVDRWMWPTRINLLHTEKNI